MKLRTLLLSLTLLVLLSVGTGCGDIGCTPPSFDFANAAKAARGWVEACLNGQNGNARQYWTRAAEGISDQLCQVLTDARATSGDIQIVSIDEPISFLCMKQVYVILQRKSDGKKGLLVFFVESGSPSAAENVVLMGVLYGAACPIVDMRQAEYRDYFENCFWAP